MKNIFTYGIFLFFLLGMGNNVKATTFTAQNSGTWFAKSTWYPAGTDTITTPANTPLPSYADDVVIPAGDSIWTTQTQGCNSITLSGTNSIFYQNGSFYTNTITVNSGATFNMRTSLYCLNIFNYGKFYCPGSAGTGSPKTLYLGVGFTYSAGTYTAAYPTGDYSIVNDGRFGDFASSAVKGLYSSGIYIYYNRWANSISINPSSSSVTPVAFAIAAIAPYASGGTGNPTSNFTLNIGENIALVKYSTVFCFSLQNSDVFSGTRTCNIAAGVTLSIAGYFHVKGSVIAQSQGNMVYNINGTLDFASLATGSTVNEMDLYTSATSPNVAINVNSGGSLILGKAVKLIASAATGQTIAISPATGSNVTFGQPTGLAVQTPITLTNATFPTSFGNLTVNNSYGVTLANDPTVSGNLNLSGPLYNTVTLNGITAQTITGVSPVKGLIINNSLGATLASALRVRNALTLTSGKVTLGSNNLIAGSISGGSSTNYVVTSGTGALSLNSDATLGTLFPIGTTTGYAPVTITPAANDTVSASVSATPTGAYTGYTINANEWTLTPQNATTATLGFMPTATISTAAPIIFSGVLAGSYITATAATLTSGTYSATGISLPVTATPFATGGSPVTAIESNTNNNLLIYSAKNTLVVRNATIGDLVTVYGISGIRVASSIVRSDNTTVSLTPGIYIVKAGSTVQKVSVQ